MDIYLFYHISHALHDLHTQHQKSDDGQIHHTYKINMIYESAQITNSHDMEFDLVDLEQRDEHLHLDEVTQIYCNIITHESKS